MSGETKRARTTPSMPGDTDDQGPGHADHHELAPGDAERPQRRVRLALDEGLPGQSLTDNDHADECGEPGQDPPADGLGWMERSIAAASLSMSVSERPSSAFDRVWNSGKPAEP